MKPKRTYHPALARYFEARGRLGGKARAKALSKGQRSRIARKAAKARWSKRRKVA